jgi:hypothetical protein|tara:strand:- start:893 stop:1312 length:420 start_codon:yes stop_codon:yes gene_type:complete
MSEPTLNKPIPEITDMTRPFWEAAKRQQLLLQKCQHCSTFNFLPKPWCIECGSRELVWTEAKPFGTVYSFTVSRSVAMNFPGWKDDLPVIMCLIDLDDGARMYAQVTGCSTEEVSIGMRVKVYFEDISDALAIPKFSPV